MEIKTLKDLLIKYGFGVAEKKNTCYSSCRKPIPISKILSDFGFKPKFYDTIIGGKRKTIVRYFGECPVFIQHEALNGRDKQWHMVKRFDNCYQSAPIDLMQEYFPSLSFYPLNFNTLRVTDFKKTLDIFSKRYHELDTGKRGRYLRAGDVISNYFSLKSPYA